MYSIIIPVIPFQLEVLGYEQVSGLAGWLLFAYSGGLLLSTFPIAMLSERYNARKWPLILGFLVLIASQIMFMEAPNYAVMCVARVLQGVASAIVFVVGLALVAETTPEHLVGQQLGLAMIGFSAGLSLGPPIGGALYAEFGFRGPFIFGSILAAVDLVGRFVIIERKDALQWGYDPLASSTVVTNEVDSEAVGEMRAEKADSVTVKSDIQEIKDEKPKQLSFLAVSAKLAKSPRAIAAGTLSFLYGTLYSAQEPTLPVHLESVWGLSSGKVGLVFIAAHAPSLLSLPLAGWLSDKRTGAAPVTIAFLLMAIPWVGVMTIEGPLALFVVAFGVSSFFTSGVVSPITAELAIVSRDIEGVGYAHVYGAFNAAYAVGSTIGPVIGGQMYDHIPDGMQAILWVVLALCAVGVVVAVFLTGERPYAGIIWGWLKGRKPEEAEQNPADPNPTSL